MILSRGVSEVLYKQLAGELRPKQTGAFVYAYSYGEDGAMYDSGVQYGETFANAVHRHQWKQEGLPTSGIYTTTIRERARFYALSGGNATRGYIYEIDANVLHQHRVRAFRVADHVPKPAVPEDDEHILVSEDGGAISATVILRVVEVYAHL